MSDSAVRKVEKGKEPNGEKLLTEKQKTLPDFLKKKIIESKKSGAGYSLGGGVGVKTPIGPLRLDVASKDLSGDWRYTLGVGWKF